MGDTIDGATLLGGDSGLDGFLQGLNNMNTDALLAAGGPLELLDNPTSLLPFTMDTCPRQTAERTLQGATGSSDLLQYTHQAPNAGASPGDSAVPGQWQTGDTINSSSTIKRSRQQAAEAQEDSIQPRATTRPPRQRRKPNAQLEEKPTQQAQRTANTKELPGVSLLEQHQDTRPRPQQQQLLPAHNGLTGNDPMAFYGDPSTCGSAISESELKHAYCSSVQALKDYITVANLLSYDILGKNLPEKLTRDLKMLIHQISKVCLQAIKPDTPHVINVISKDYTQATTVDWELDKGHWVNVIAHLQLTDNQVMAILRARSMHVDKLMGMYQERSALAQRAHEMAAASCTQGNARLGVEDHSMMGVLMRHGYLYCARNVITLHHVLELMKDSIAREQRVVMELFLKVVYQVLSPVQAALFVVESFPYHCDVLALGNVLSMMYGSKMEAMAGPLSPDFGIFGGGITGTSLRSTSGTPTDILGRGAGQNSSGISGGGFGGMPMQNGPHTPNGMFNPMPNGMHKQTNGPLQNGMPGRRDGLARLRSFLDTASQSSGMPGPDATLGALSNGLQSCVQSHMGMPNGTFLQGSSSVHGPDALPNGLPMQGSGGRPGSVMGMDGLSGLPSQQLQGLPSRQLQSLPSQQLQGLPSQQLQSLPSQQLQGLPSQQLQSLPSRQLQGLPSQQLPGLPSQQLQSLPSQQLQGLSGQQPQGLPSQQLQGLPSHQLQGMPGQQQTQGIGNQQQLQGMGGHQFQGLGSQQLQGMGMHGVRSIGCTQPARHGSMHGANGMLNSPRLGIDPLMDGLLSDGRPGSLGGANGVSSRAGQPRNLGSNGGLPALLPLDLNGGEQSRGSKGRSEGDAVASASGVNGSVTTPEANGTLPSGYPGSPASSKANRPSRAGGNTTQPMQGWMGQSPHANMVDGGSGGRQPNGNMPTVLRTALSGQAEGPFGRVSADLAEAFRSFNSGGSGGAMAGMNGSPSPGLAGNIGTGVDLNSLGLGMLGGPFDMDMQAMGGMDLHGLRMEARRAAGAQTHGLPTPTNTDTGGARKQQQQKQGGNGIPLGSPELPQSAKSFSMGGQAASSGMPMPQGLWPGAGHMGALNMGNGGTANGAGGGSGAAGMNGLGTSGLPSISVPPKSRPVPPSVSVPPPVSSASVGRQGGKAGSGAAGLPVISVPREPGPLGSLDAMHGRVLTEALAGK